MAPAGFFVVGYLGKPKGLKGELLLKTEAGKPEEYQKTESVFLLIKGKPVPFLVLSFRPQPGKKTAVLFLEDVDSVEKARELSGTPVLLLVTEKPEDNELPYAGLQGYQVTDRVLGLLGNIESVVQYPGHTVAQLHYRNREVMFPLTPDLIEKVDKQKQELFVDLPEGLLEIYMG
ncbi:MAG TPA: ribosome maturation factor RimM [Anseongella sp.]